MAATSSEEEEVLKGSDPSRLGKGDLLRDALRRLAELSLEDYKWRSSAFKTTQADRLMEQSIARMRGEDAAYVRPMDANEKAIGPLGRFEKAVVEWLSNVIEEEATRAKRIVNSGGQLARPIDAGEGERGPLGFLEQRVVETLQRISNSEKVRARTKTLRPKDLEETDRGPLGELELKAVLFLREVEESERLRMEQSRSRGGEIVRPIDVPGPLGEWEMAISEIFYAEEKRAQDLEKNPGKVIRPKDARLPGPFGKAELMVNELLMQLRTEENERLRNIQKVAENNRPMERDSNSFLGMVETVLVGIVRAPQMFASVIDRVGELLASKPMDDADAEIVQERGKLKSSSGPLTDDLKP
jgi:hypothetical protein